jgi:hypothetical protein
MISQQLGDAPRCAGRPARPEVSDPAAKGAVELPWQGGDELIKECAHVAVHPFAGQHFFISKRQHDGWMRTGAADLEDLHSPVDADGAPPTHIRRLHILLRQEGVMINRKKTQRIYQEEGLAIRRRRSRKRAVGTRAPAPVIALPNQRWSLDFVHNQMASGRRFRVLNIVDDVTKECLRAVRRRTG